MKNQPNHQPYLRDTSDAALDARLRCELCGTDTSDVYQYPPGCITRSPIALCSSCYWEERYCADTGRPHAADRLADSDIS